MNLGFGWDGHVTRDATGPDPPPGVNDDSRSSSQRCLCVCVLVDMSSGGMYLLQQTACQSDLIPRATTVTRDQLPRRVVARVMNAQRCRVWS